MLGRLRLIDSAADLAHKLTESTWTSCQAFVLDGYLFANDATCADGAQEYAVLKAGPNPGELVQIESITFSWCNDDRASELILRILSGDFDQESYGRVCSSRFRTAREHGTCHLCA